MKKTYVLNRLKALQKVLVPSDTGEIFLQIDGKPELPPDKGRNRIVLNMNIGDSPIEAEVKAEVNKLLTLGVSRKRIRREFGKAGVDSLPYIPEGVKVEE